MDQILSRNGNLRFIHTKQHDFNFGKNQIQLPGTEQYDLFSKGLAQFTRSIGHPARIAVLIALAQHGEKPLRSIVEIPGLSRSTVLQHLRELKRAGLIQGNLYGSKTEYSLDLTRINEFDEKFSDFLSRLRNPLVKKE